MTEVVQLMPRQVVSVVKNESPRRIATGGLRGQNGLPGISLTGTDNRLINGDGAINQRVVASASDDTYAWDRHCVLTQTAAIGTTTIIDVADGLPSMMRLTQSQVTAQRMGVVQIVESANCKDLRSAICTLLGKVRCSIATNIRYAILVEGAADPAAISDVVLTWTSSNYTQSNFFDPGVYPQGGVGVKAVSANAITDFSLLSNPLLSGTTNVIVFIWTESAVAQNVTMDVAWEFVKGDATALTYPITKRHRGEELRLCQRYYAKSYGLAVAPGTATLAGGYDMFIGTAVTSALYFTARWPVMLRTASPTLVVYDAAGAAGKVFKGANGKTVSVPAVNENGANIGTVDATSANELFFQYTADAEL